MTPVQLTAILNTVEEDLKDEHAAANALFKSGERTFEKYKKFTTVMESCSHESDDLEGMTMSKLESTIKDFKDELANGDFILCTNSEAELESDVWDSYLEKLVLRQSYYAVCSKHTLDSHIKSFKRTRFSDLLKPCKSDYARTLDCKIAALFMDGNIDWSMLQTITYGDCEI